jgi:predicted O-methyltransferase YrrM
VGRFNFYHPIRLLVNPIRDRIRARRVDPLSIQRSVLLAEEDRCAKRKRWHVLADLVHEHCPKSDAVVVELGVRTGHTSAHLLKYCPQIRSLYAVDLEPLPPDRRWVLALHCFHFVQGDSAAAAASFDDESVDLVFIDADHSEEGVRRDIAAWLPKLRLGGILSGHDYGSTHHAGVTRAVDDFARRHWHPLEVDANRVWWTVR